MALTKKQRNLVWNKSGGKCWYCGNGLLDKGWHADHFEPLYRDCGVSGDLYPARDVIDNLVPSCVPCNLFKSVFTVEQFRYEIEQQILRARKSSVNFRTAERFGLIEIKPTTVIFWFEQQGL